MNEKGAIAIEMVISLVLTVIVLLVLLYLAVNVWGLFNDDTGIEKAERELDKLVEAIRVYRETGKRVSVNFFPAEGWFLRTFPDGDYKGACRDSKFISCVCICETESCNDLIKRRCKGFEFDISVVGSYSKLIAAGAVDSSGIRREGTYDLFTTESIILSSAEELNIGKGTPLFYSSGSYKDRITITNDRTSVDNGLGKFK